MVEPKWLTDESKYFEYDMFARPTLPWTWSTTKLKSLGSSKHVTLGLTDYQAQVLPGVTCLLNPLYF